MQHRVGVIPETLSPRRRAQLEIHVVITAADRLHLSRFLDRLVLHSRFIGHELRLRDFVDAPPRPMPIGPDGFTQSVAAQVEQNLSAIEVELNATVAADRSAALLVRSAVARAPA